MAGPRRIDGEGGCSCGYVRYRYRGEPLVFYACHCTDCQTRTGAAFGFSMVIRDADLELLAGETTTAGEEVEPKIRTRNHCPRCGTCIFTDGRERFEGILVLRPGTLDDTSALDPCAHLWVRSKQPWVQLPEGVKTYDTQPDDLTELLAVWQQSVA